MSKAQMIVDVQVSLFLGPWPVPGASAMAAHDLGFKISVARNMHATYDGGYPGSEDPTPASEISDRIQRELEALK